MKVCAEDWNVSLTGLFSVAVTWIAKGKIPATGENKPFPSAIQLCGGTIKNIKNGKFNRYGNMRSGSLLGKSRNAKLIKNKYGWREVGTVFFY